MLAAVATLVAAVLIGGGWWLTHRDRADIIGAPGPLPSSVTPSTPAAPATSPPATSPPTATPEGWRMLPDAPLAGWETGPVSVWTGTEMLVFSTTSTTDAPATSAGAGYDPVTGRWRELAPIPAQPGRFEGIGRAVWTGTEMIVVGTVNSGAYNPATNQWRSLGPTDSSAVVVWTGRQVLMWGGGCCGSFSATGSAYTPATDSWRPLPPSPLAGRADAAGAWTGTELVIAGGQNDEQTFADAAAYNPATRTWRRLSPLPAPRAGVPATWTGTEVILVGGHLPRPDGLYADGVAYNPTTNRWRRTAAMPVGRWQHTAVWTGEQLLVWGGLATGRDDNPVVPPHGYAYDPSTDRWSGLPGAPLRGRVEHTAVWTGHQMLIWGGRLPAGTEARLYDGAAYRP